MTTAEKLTQYYPFSEETLAAVEDTAERQNRYSFRELADQLGIDNAHIRTNIDGKAVEYLHIQPGDPASDAVRVLFSPMGNGLRENIVMRAMRLAEADNPEHLFVIGSPAHIGNPNNLLTRRERVAVAGGHFEPLSYPILDVLSRRQIQRVDALGYSLGATAAQGLVLAASDYGIETDKAVFAEPANTQERSLFRLLKDFAASGKELDQYVQQSESTPLNEAIDAARDDIRFFAGLARLSNVAIARGLAKNTFDADNDLILNGQPNVQITSVFAEHSTLAKLGKEDDLRIGRIMLRGAHHAAGDDIDLHAAIMLQGLELRPKI